MRRGIALVVLVLLATSARGDGRSGEYWGPYRDRTAPRGDPPPNRPAGPPRAVEDVLAFWPFWFEREKEVLLAERLLARRAAATVDRERLAKEAVPLILEILTHESERVRATAVRALGQAGGAEVVPPLRERLSDPRADVREQACLALGLSGAPAAGEILRGILADGAQGDLRRWAALGLGLLRDDAAAEPLLAALRAEGDAARAAPIAAAAIALGAIGTEAAVPALGKLLSTPDPEAGSRPNRAAACQALSRIRGDEALAWLLRSAASRDHAVRAAAMRALGAFPENRAVAALMKDGRLYGDRTTHTYALLSLGRCLGQFGSAKPGDAIRKRLVREAMHPTLDRYRSQYAILALALAGDHAADEYLLELTGPESRATNDLLVAGAAAMALGLLRVPEAGPPLRELVADRDYDADTRGYAAFALGLLGDPAAAGAIRREMDRADAPSELLRSGAWALGLVGDDSDVPRLLGLFLRDGSEYPDHAVRFAAARALGILGSEAAVAPLLRIVGESEDPVDLAFAIRALGFLLDPSPVDRVPELLSGLHHRCEPWIVDRVRRGHRR